MSKIYVDEIAGIASPSTVAIPGHVIQVVQGTSNSASATTSTSFTATNLTASITPSSASSKILVTIHGTSYADSGNVQPIITIYRDSTNLGESARGFNQYWPGGASGQAMQVVQAAQYLDSPGTTDSLTYTAYHRVNSGTASFGFDTGTQVITLMEIAG